MPFTYRPDGRNFILLPESSTRYAGDAGLQTEVQAFAQRKANETGHAVDIFAADGTTFLTRATSAA